jgi:aklavinone 12-hydroxylase
MWSLAAARASATLGIPVALAPLDAEIGDAFGLGTGGASLVRPDGVIAWRTSNAPSDPARELGAALAAVASAARA